MGQVHADATFHDGEPIAPQLEIAQSIPFSSPPAPPCIPKYNAAFNVLNPVQCLDDNVFSFENITGIGAVTYQWNFGDG